MLSLQLVSQLHIRFAGSSEHLLFLKGQHRTESMDAMTTDWSQDPLVAPATSTPPVPDNGTPESPSTTTAVKQEATDVGHEGLDAAKNVAQTAGAEVKNVAQEAGAQAKDLLGQLGSDLKSQAGSQQQKVTDGIRSISDELSSMAESTDEGLAKDLVQQAARRTDAVAGWLDGRDPGSLLDEVTGFARRRPGAFLLVAAGAGLLAGRLARGLTAGNGSSPQDLGPAPVHPPTIPAAPLGGTASSSDAGVVWAADAPPAGVGAYTDNPEAGPRP